MSNASIEDSGYPPTSKAPRGYSQIIGAVSLNQGSLAAISFNCLNTNNWTVSGNHGDSGNTNQRPFATPSVSDSGYHFFPVHLFEAPAAGRTMRGTARGLMHVLESLPQASGYSILSGVENLTGNIMLLVRSGGYVMSNNTPNFITVQTAIAFSLGDW